MTDLKPGDRVLVDHDGHLHETVVLSVQRKIVQVRNPRHKSLHWNVPHFFVYPLQENPA